jgi:hypothetical protein
MSPSQKGHHEIFYTYTNGFEKLALWAMTISSLAHRYNFCNSEHPNPQESVLSTEEVRLQTMIMLGREKHYTLL